MGGMLNMITQKNHLTMYFIPGIVLCLERVTDAIWPFLETQ